MRLRSIVMTVLAGVSAVAVPAAAMEMAGPDRPRVTPTTAVPAPAADQPSPTVATTSEPAAAETAPTTVATATAPAPEPAATTAPPVPKAAAAQVEARRPVVDAAPLGEQQALRLACVAGKPDGAPAVRCQWSTAEGVHHYALFRKTADGQPERIYDGADTAFVDRSVTEGTAYGYGVKAIGPGGAVIGRSEIVRVSCCATGAA